jgi:hypothetical protein
MNGWQNLVPLALYPQLHEEYTYVSVSPSFPRQSILVRQIFGVPVFTTDVGATEH